MQREYLQNLTITFVSLNKDIVNAFNDVFPKNDSRYKNISVVHSNIGQCSIHDCIVSPTNSFGLMDGGIDRAISYMLNTIDDVDYIGKKVRNVIHKKHGGEQPIGTCMIISTDNLKFPYLAHAPTMRIPRNSVNTLNPYYAFKAVLCEVLNFNETQRSKIEPIIKSILTTTFCTGCGEMPLRMAFLQMKKAYDVVYEGIQTGWVFVSILDKELEKLRELTIEEDLKEMLVYSDQTQTRKINF